MAVTLSAWIAAGTAEGQLPLVPAETQVSDATSGVGELAFAWRGRSNRRRRGAVTVPAARDSAVESESVAVEEPKPETLKTDETKPEEPKAESPKAQVTETEPSTPAEAVADKPSDHPSEATSVAEAGSRNAAEGEPSASEGDRVTVLKPILTHSTAMTEIHNQYRAQVGLPAQSVDENLSKVAQDWAEHMASVGSMYHGSGEQIIAYSGSDRSYDAGFRTWLGSPPHRAWLCSRGDLCGFGYAIGRNGCAYYAGAFGNRPVIRQASSESSTVVSTASYSTGRQARRARRR